MNLINGTESGGGRDATPPAMPPAELEAQMDTMSQRRRRQPAAVPPSAELPRRSGPRGKKVKKPDPIRHADGVASSYSCGKRSCTGVMLLNPAVELLHGDAGRCTDCDSVRRYCAACGGFFDGTRVVCHEADADFKFSRNGQHPLNHAARSSMGGRRLRHAPTPGTI